jgi:transcription termination factor Rho
MTAEQQLERSVLESKERDELHTIAQAMSIKTTTRTKKADIIDQILQATGIIPSDGEAGASNGSNGGNGAKPRAPKAQTTTDDGADTTAPAQPPAALEAPAESDGVALSTVEEAKAAEVRGDYPRNNNQSNQSNQNNQNGQGRPQNQQQQHRNAGPGPGNQMGGVEAGNRRGRRRRGRERVPGASGELQGGTNQDAPYQGEMVEVKGLLDLRDEGYGFLRCDGYLPSNKDVYVSISQARRFALRKGDYIEGACRPAANNEKYPALLRIDTVSKLDPEAARNRPRFEDLTPLFPDSKLVLEMPGDKDNVTARIVDLLSPIGKGQRGLIVSPPKAGKTTVMKQVAHSIEANNPDVHLMVLLVDERPEEVTDMRRSVRGEVVASTFDRPSEEHTAVAELAIERAKRLVELGQDVVIILDGITRLARAYNLAAPATGRIMSGGVDSGALYPPKKFFGAARNIEEGGSLTILATALVETGSKMDEVIFEEFKGTGNMELRLDRRLAERRLYPSIDVNASSTRHEELLFDRGELQQVWKLRRVLNALANDGNAASGLELLMDKIRTTKSNEEFLAEIAKGPGA